MPIKTPVFQRWRAVGLDRRELNIAPFRRALNNTSARQSALAGAAASGGAVGPGAGAAGKFMGTGIASGSPATGTGIAGAGP